MKCPPRTRSPTRRHDRCPSFLTDGSRAWFGGTTRATTAVGASLQSGPTQGSRGEGALQSLKWHHPASPLLFFSDPLIDLEGCFESWSPAVESAAVSPQTDRRLFTTNNCIHRG